MKKSLLLLTACFLMVGCVTRSPEGRQNSENQIYSSGTEIYSNSHNSQSNKDDSDFIRIEKLYGTSAFVGTPNTSGNLAPVFYKYTQEEFIAHRESRALFYTPIDADISRYTFKCYSSNSLVFKINENSGACELHRPGTAFYILNLYANGEQEFSLARQVTCNQLKPITSFSVDSTLTVASGSSKRMNYSIAPSDATESKVITCTSSDPSVATVDSLYYVYGHKAGTAVIEAKIPNGMVSRCVVTVTGTQATSFSLSSSYTLAPGSTTTLKPTFYPSGCNYGKTMTYVSSTPSIATVDEKGLVTAISPGTCTIKATLENGYSKDITINVSQYIYPTSIVFNPKTINLDINGSKAPAFTIYPANANTQKTVTFTSSNSSVARYEDGIIKGISSGSCTITASLPGGISDTCTVNVSSIVLPTEIKLSETYLNLDVNATHQLTVTYIPSNTTDKTVTWSSSKQAVATVNNGLITTIKGGYAYIYATHSSGLKVSCSVNVKQVINPTALTLPNSLDVGIGQSVSIQYSIVPSDANTDTQITWTSSDTKVATVNYYGIINGLTKGSCIITGTLKNGISSKISVNVDYFTPTSVTIESALTVETGKFQFVNPVTTPENGRKDLITYTSSNSSIAKVDQYGCVFGINIGQATITAKLSNGASSSCVVTVIQAQDTAISISFSTKSKTISKGETFAFVYTLNPTYPTKGNVVTWTSSNSSIASVDAYGVITGKSAGTVTITGKLPNNAYDTCTITVTN